MPWKATWNAIIILILILILIRQLLLLLQRIIIIIIMMIIIMVVPGTQLWEELAGLPELPGVGQHAANSYCIQHVLSCVVI